MLQQYKVNTPYARAGDVLVANGGDVAKQMGLIPSWATVPHGTPRWSNSITVFEPNMGDTVGRNFRITGDANVFEGQFNWEVRTEYEAPLRSGTAFSSYCCGWARYAVDVDLSGIAEQPLVLVLFDYSPATGTPVGTVDIALNYKPGPVMGTIPGESK